MLVSVGSSTQGLSLVQVAGVLWMGETLEEVLGYGKRGCGKWDYEQCCWPANRAGVFLEYDP